MYGKLIRIREQRFFAASQAFIVWGIILVKFYSNPETGYVRQEETLLKVMADKTDLEWEVDAACEEHEAQREEQI